ncbi:hypothetical protein JHK86_036082 [Glycine max]|nr:hypothetical protein JHK86_036073 [Glycine max]KAG4976608.1 hypothetical protein JHK86_036082 [Glycine max]
MNSIGPKNDTLEESSESSNINRLIVPLLYLPKGKKISESYFLDPKESTRVLPITKKYIMPESNWGSRWWRNWIGKKSDSSCKISNETIAGIEISFKEKDIKYLEFLFVYYMDDPIRKDHDWEFFDRLSPRKRRNIINLNSGQLFEILVKDWIYYLMFAFREKIPKEVEGFFKQQGTGWSELHLSSNPTERSTRDQKLLKKEQKKHLVLSRRSENKEIVNLFKIIMYLQNTVSIHPISSYPGCDMVPKGELDSSNKISFLNKNPIDLLEGGSHWRASSRN